MKTTLNNPTRLILTSIAMLIISTTFGQERSVTKIKHHDHKPSLRTKVSSQRAEISNAFKKGLNLLEDADTLHFPLNGEYSLYISDEGYVSGNNEYEDKAKAEFFNIDQPQLLTGFLIDFAVATGGGNVQIAVWDNSGSSGSPGTEIVNINIPMTNIISDVQNNYTTFIELNNPIILESSFYAGVILPNNAGDTIAVWTNTDGDSSPATAWELWSDNTWVKYDNPDGWNLSVSHAIFPIVDSDIGLNASFTSDITQVNPGQSVQFNDNSYGNPISWEWTFEGGLPNISTEQNPTITYDQLGSYDVKLKISDGANSDSLIIENYISVSEIGLPQIDTLNYPLPGEHALYVFEQGDGGYVTGTNYYNDKAKANFFNINEEVKIVGLLFEFAVAEGGNPDIEMAIWNNNGISNSPGTILISGNTNLNSIIEDVNNQQLTFIEFNQPIIIDHPFYAGFKLPSAENDVLAVLSNTDGNTNPGIGWELWEDNNWYSMNAAPSVELNIAMAIHPVVDYNVGINTSIASRLMNIFPNPTDGVFYLETENLRKDAKVGIYNSVGTLVYENIIHNSPKQSKIDVSGLESGIYIIKVISNQDTFFNKIIKN
jgi:PKD repeat protein